ncbi:VanW family protein [Clostridium estertheticum]|uniref:VanW family protein n=1 Tax=Clostridium estertheticum TaxID=238834 RepID=UPI001C6F4BB2|nr:VanW family protein [Clostridium estertheticum]MBW9153131.1 VanW family protein [Clostridium estertheticum]WLC83700.1 VanW family protein [Clostridium estertheticum]
MISNIVKNPRNKNKKVTKQVSIIAGVVLVLFVLQCLLIHNAISKYKLKIYPQVWIEDTNIGGKTKMEAKNAIIQKHNNSIAKKNITIKINNKQYTIALSKLDMKYDYGLAVDKAYDIGKEGNSLKKYFAITSPLKKNITLNHTYNYDIVDTVLKDIIKDNNKKAVDATIVRNDLGDLIVTKEEYGHSIDSASLKKEIKTKVENIKQEQTLLIESKLINVEPKIKNKNLEGINTLISSSTTNFGNSNESRSENIRVASDSINGHIVMPGDLFSFNDVVGERSAKKGYKLAKGIVNDKLVDDLGGGVCQVSTTLYNAILRTNIASVERYHHSLPCSYIGKGLDATVSFGLLDYRFKNTYSYPIFIESGIENENLTFNVYSNASLSKKKYNIYNKVTGNHVNVFRITYENGNRLSKVLLYTDKIS